MYILFCGLIPIIISVNCLFPLFCAGGGWSVWSAGLAGLVGWAGAAGGTDVYELVSAFV